MRRIREWFSVALAHYTRTVIALMIVLINALFILLGGTILYYASAGLYADVPDAIIGTIKMILDAGFMAETPDHRLTALFIIVVVVGMIVFSGATMGYLVNFISRLISEAEGGRKRLLISNHVIILNWNMRASEIVNELLFAHRRERVVVLVNEDREAVLREIHARIAATLKKERQKRSRTRAQRWAAARAQRHMTIIVRQGDIFSAAELDDLSLPLAKTVIVLGRDTKNDPRQTGAQGTRQGNVLTVKTLIQVADVMTHSPEPNRPRVIVEVDDEWTERLTTVVAERIAKLQQENSPSIHIIPVFRTLGEILAQFSIMPELNRVYNELFSNRGATFYTVDCGEDCPEKQLIADMLRTRPCALPLEIARYGRKQALVYMADDEPAIRRVCPPTAEGPVLALNPSYEIEPTNVIIIGHNSNSRAILESFDAFRAEWRTPETDPVHLCIIDDEGKIGCWEDRDYITKYPTKTIYDKDYILDLLNRAISLRRRKMSILILSDDELPPEAFDSHVLTYLIYVRELIDSLPGTNEAIDIIVEILDPRHYDVVKSYSVDNIVISNRYVSRIVLQCGEKEMLYRFYQDVLTYDDPATHASSKEIYVKRAADYYTELPPALSEAELVSATYAASPAGNPNVLLGFVDQNRQMRFFSGDRREAMVELAPDDRLILYSCH